MKKKKGAAEGADDGVPSRLKVTRRREPDNEESLATSLGRLVMVVWKLKKKQGVEEQKKVEGLIKVVGQQKRKRRGWDGWFVKKKKEEEEMKKTYEILSDR